MPFEQLGDIFNKLSNTGQDGTHSQSGEFSATYTPSLGALDNPTNTMTFPSSKLVFEYFVALFLNR